MSKHRTSEGQAMFDHFLDTSHCGFSVEILQLASNGDNLDAMEDMWIACIAPSINGPEYWGVSKDLDNLYIHDMLTKISQGKFN